jgi:hypothetical protein
LKGKDNLSRKNARAEAMDSDCLHFEFSLMLNSVKRNLGDKQSEQANCEIMMIWRTLAVVSVKHLKR